MKPETFPDTPIAVIETGQLTYVSDQGPGIRRQRAGKGFYYASPDGGRVGDEAVLARIRALAIPPAWTDVWIAPDEFGHIQATGRDARGRKQYRYHPEWLTCRDEAKFSSLADFAGALPRLRDVVDSDLRRHGIPRERVLAAIVSLLDTTMIRIGNASYKRDNKSFGLTTLQDRHVDIEGQRMTFSFKGKSGQEWKLKLSDRRIARIVRDAQDIPGQHLFQYLDEEGGRHALHSHDVNDYIRAAIGDEFTSKHFRTWGGTRLAAVLFADIEKPETKRAATRIMNQVFDQVSKRLHNTRAVCRKCYVHPQVPLAWEEGRLVEEMADIRRRTPRPLTGLDKEESTVLRWLRQHEKDEL
jgi:DNA topoisomerase-1